MIMFVYRFTSYVLIRFLLKENQWGGEDYVNKVSFVYHHYLFLRTKGQGNRENVGFFRERRNVRLISNTFLYANTLYDTPAKTGLPRPELWKKYLEEEVIIAGNSRGSTQFVKDYN